VSDINYSLFLLSFLPVFFWYCNGFGVVAILGMLSHKYHYFLILAVQRQQLVVR